MGFKSYSIVLSNRKEKRWFQKGRIYEKKVIFLA